VVVSCSSIQSGTCVNAMLYEALNLLTEECQII
jgi:hypothetical protein